MDDFNKRISEIRNMMEDMKTEMYAISNPETAALDEYVKSLYLKMLCSIIQYENEPSEMQLLYLKRLHKGIQTDRAVEDYMRMALDLSEVDVQEFIVYMRKERVRYYFTLESILLVSMGEAEHADYEYLGELIELICISRRELEYFSVVASSILQQDSEYFDRAKIIAPETIEGIRLAPYIKDYYAGLILDTYEEKYYSSPDREKPNSIEYVDIYKNTKHVTFNNLEIQFSKDWMFEGCENVTFENCKLISNDGHKLVFSYISNLKFSNCEFIDFNDRVMSLDYVSSISILESRFEHCGITCKGDKIGGVLEILHVSEMKRLSFCKNILIGCYIVNINPNIRYGETGILMKVNVDWFVNKRYETEYVIKYNEFIGCQCIDCGRSTPAIISGINEKTEKLQCSDNKCIGEVSRLFE